MSKTQDFGMFHIDLAKADKSDTRTFAAHIHIVWM